MEKTAEKTIKLKGQLDITIKIRRSITEIKGDPWEGRPDRTLHIEDVEIQYIHPTDGEKKKSDSIYVLNNKVPWDAENIKKGAYAQITGLFLSKESYNEIKKAYDEVDSQAMFKEWKDYIDGKKMKEKTIKINNAKKIIEKGDKEILSNGNLMTIKEVCDWTRNYNNVMNEGGDGYIPERISKEEYDEAKKILQEV